MPEETNMTDVNVKINDDTAEIDNNSEFDNIAYEPNPSADGIIHFDISRDPNYDIYSGSNSCAVDFSDYDSKNFKDYIKKMNFDTGDYTKDSYSGDHQKNATTNGKMTIVLDANQAAAYQRGEMPTGVNAFNPAEYSENDQGFLGLSKDNFDGGEFKDMFSYFKQTQDEGGMVLQMDRGEYEKTFGIPYIEPINYINDKQYGDAIKIANEMRPGAQILFLSDAEIEDIRNGRGLTVDPTTLGDNQTSIDKDLFKSGGEELGSAARNAESAFPGKKMYLLTPEELAMINGQDLKEVKKELKENQLIAEEKGKQDAFDASFLGQLTKVSKEIVSTIGTYAKDFGHMIQEKFFNKQGKTVPILTANEVTPAPEFGPESPAPKAVTPEFVSTETTAKKDFSSSSLPVNVSTDANKNTDYLNDYLGNF